MSNIKINSLPEAVFKRFDGFRVTEVNKSIPALFGMDVRVEMERAGVLITVQGSAADVDRLIAIEPSEYWDGGHDPVIGQIFSAELSGYQYRVEFPVYRDGMLVGCHAVSVNAGGSAYFSIAAMKPGKPPLTEGQQNAISDVVHMYKSGWISQEQSDRMIDVIRNSTKS